MKNFFKNLFSNKKTHQEFSEKKITENNSNIEQQQQEVQDNELEKGNKTDIRVPRLSDDIHEVHVKNYQCKIGDIVKKGDILCELESDKFTMEFESFFTGKVIYINPNKTVKVDEIIITLEEV